MSDVLHELTAYAQREPDPGRRWADELSRLTVENAELRTLNSVLVEALAEAQGILIEQMLDEGCSEWMKQAKAAIAKAEAAANE